ncbi:MAG: hypothetical protein DRJ68_06360 [Thermoprotei archaeon]|nr:MAG: hypothetical protein DRJ68_06360 [Thermoprotei archaeon]
MMIWRYRLLQSEVTQYLEQLKMAGEWWGLPEEFAPEIHVPYERYEYTYAPEYRYEYAPKVEYAPHIEYPSIHLELHKTYAPEVHVPYEEVHGPLEIKGIPQYPGAGAPEVKPGYVAELRVEKVSVELGGAIPMVIEAYRTGVYRGVEVGRRPVEGAVVDIFAEMFDPSDKKVKTIIIGRGATDKTGRFAFSWIPNKEGLYVVYATVEFPDRKKVNTNAVSVSVFSSVYTAEEMVRMAQSEAKLEEMMAWATFIATIAAIVLVILKR